MTKVLTWNAVVGQQMALLVGDAQVVILDETVSAKYLGTTLASKNGRHVDLQNRITSGWVIFSKHQKNDLMFTSARM